MDNKITPTFNNIAYIPKNNFNLILLDKFQKLGITYYNHSKHIIPK